MDAAVLGNVLVSGGALIAWLLSQATSKTRATRREVKALRVECRLWRERDLAWETLIYELDRENVRNGRPKIVLPPALSQESLDKILAVAESGDAG